MSNVFVCAAEQIAAPLPNQNDAASSRYRLLCDFLVWELSALFNAHYLTALAYDPAHSIAGFFDGALTAVIPVSPNAITHPNVVVSTVSTVNALAFFVPDMIICLSGGLDPVDAAVSAIATLKTGAIADGVLWRDASNLGPGLPYPPQPVYAPGVTPATASAIWAPTDMSPQTRLGR